MVPSNWLGTQCWQMVNGVAYLVEVWHNWYGDDMTLSTMTLMLTGFEWYVNKPALNYTPREKPIYQNLSAVVDHSTSGHSTAGQSTTEHRTTGHSTIGHSTIVHSNASQSTTLPQAILLQVTLPQASLAGHSNGGHSTTSHVATLPPTMYPVHLEQRSVPSSYYYYHQNHIKI